MYTIILEGALFVTVTVMACALVAYGVSGYTPLGRWARQVANRRRIEQAAVSRAIGTCPEHGVHDERDLVRLPDGGLLCPECYREAFDLTHPQQQR